MNKRQQQQHGKLWAINISPSAEVRLLCTGWYACPCSLVSGLRGLKGVVNGSNCCAFVWQHGC
jgi:hypothetical protein